MEPTTTAAPVVTARSDADRLTKAILFVGLLAFAMGQTVLFALLGPVARDIGLAEWQVGAIVSASAVVFVFVSPVWGRRADRWGRKAVIVTCLGCYALATLLFAAILHVSLGGLLGATAAFVSLVAARLLYAITSSGIQPAAVAFMADLTSAKDRSAGVALVGAGFGFGTVLGPALAAGLVGFGVLVPLFAAAGLALVAAVVGLWHLREPRGAAARQVVAGAVPIRSIGPHLGLAFGVYVAIATIQQTTSFYIQDFTSSGAGEAARRSGFAFMALALAMLVVQGGAVQVFKPSPHRMLAIGLPLAAIGVAAYALAPSFGWIVAAFALMGAGFGLVQPGVGALVSLATDTDAQGGAAGYVQAAMAGGFVVGPLASTLFYSLSPRAPMLLALASLALCIVLFVALRSQSRRQPVLATAPD